MMEENMIANTMEEKDLGIIIDNKLNFQNHINKQVNKANQKLGLIRDRPFNLKWGVMVFCFVPNFFFGPHKS
jgi:tetrahydromethanopterin S-methyltransferase subunit F